MPKPRGMGSRTRAAALLTALSCLAADGTRPDDRLLSFDTEECLQYRYDLTASDVSEAELSEILALVGPIYTLRERWTAHLRLCIEGDPAYRPCGSRKPSSPHFLHNARVNLAQGQRLLNRVEALRSSLAELERHYAFQYGFWIELGTRKLDYLRLRDPRLLSAPLRDLDVAGSCGSQAAALAAIDGDDDTVLGSFKDWHNCANHLMHDSPTQTTGYPKAAWQAFLEAEGIREQITPLPDCEQEF